MDQEFDFRGRYDIVDAQKNPVYEVNGNLISHTFQIKASDGADVDEIKKKIVTLASTYESSFANGQTALLKKRLDLLK